MRVIRGQGKLLRRIEKARRRVVARAELSES
jgi:hypothetical protein